MTASVQPAFSFRSAEASGELHRRNQPAFKPYASDRPVLKKIAGPTCHICVLPADAWLSFFCFNLLPIAPPPDPLTPPPLRSRLHAATSRRRSPTTHAAARLHAASRAAAAAHSPQHRLRALLRRLRTRRHHLRRSAPALAPAPPTRRPCAAATVCLHAAVRVRAAVPAPHTAHAAARFTAAAAAAPSRSQGARRFARATSCAIFAPLSLSCTPAPRSRHRQSRWVARRERERRLLSRSPSASGPAQREGPRGPRWWLRPPRSRHQAVLDHSVSGSSQPGAKAEVWVESEVPDTADKGRFV